MVGKPILEQQNAVTRKKGFSFHSHLLIYGKEEEFKRLENLIKDFIEVTPRKF